VDESSCLKLVGGTAVSDPARFAKVRGGDKKKVGVVSSNILIFQKHFKIL